MDQLLLIMLADNALPKQPKDMREIGKSVGVRGIAKWNISLMLSRSKGRAITVEGGWEVSPAGMADLTQRGLVGNVQVTQQATSLRTLLPKIFDARIRDFVEEAIACYEIKSCRPAVVQAWVGALALLQEHVIKYKLADFNAEMKRRDAKWKPAITTDDLADIKEDTFLDVLHAISVIGKSVKDELKARLKLRNGGGHPNSLRIGELVAAAHLESLINNVFTVF
ncbi:MAG TPA: hypothetical protein VJO12_14875 [Stellaceae bacterium]|nr:hypothetical protein [Stellaceae bacterium]